MAEGDDTQAQLPGERVGQDISSSRAIVKWTADMVSMMDGWRKGREGGIHTHRGERDGMEWTRMGAFPWGEDSWPSLTAHTYNYKVMNEQEDIHTEESTGTRLADVIVCVCLSLCVEPAHTVLAFIKSKTSSPHTHTHTQPPPPTL